MINKKIFLYIPIVLISVNMFGVGTKPTVHRPSGRMYNINNPALEIAHTFTSLQKVLLDTLTQDNKNLEKVMYAYLIRLVGTFIEQYEEILNNFDNRTVLLEELRERMVALRDEYINEEHEILDLVDQYNLQNLHQRSLESFRELMDYAGIILSQALTTPDEIREAMRKTSESLEAYNYIRDEFQDAYDAMR